MKMQIIPKTNLKVSPICLGTMTFGTPVGEADAIRLLHYASDKGINFIDTANMYEGYSRVPGSSGGVAEEIICKAIAGRRDKFVLATKVGMKVGNAPEDENISPAAIRKQLDNSLKRMGTHYVDIYYLHKPDPLTPLVETLGAIHGAICSGKIRHYGISNFSAEEIKELLKVADSNDLPRPVMCQPPLSLLKQSACEYILPLCQKEAIAVVPYQILQGGLLSGKYKRGQPLPPDSRKAEKDTWVWQLTDEIFDKLEQIEKSAHEANCNMTQYVIRWILQQPAVLSAIIGVKNKGQIDEAVESF